MTVLPYGRATHQLGGRVVVDIVGGADAPDLRVPLVLSGDEASQQKHRPVQVDVALPEAERPQWLRAFSLWLFRDTLVLVESDAGLPIAELLTRIKYAAVEASESRHRILPKTRRELLRREMELEITALGGPAVDPCAPVRERIPDPVRIFVWRRDGGKCVCCGSRERLEFDHIIPVADGGSSTERNIQLLCETCNRSKGRSVS